MGIHREGWGILGWDDHAHTILTAAMGSGDPQAREAATALTTFRCRNDDRHRPGMRERAGGQDPSAHFWIPCHPVRDGRRSEVPSRSWPGATEYQQIIGNDPQPDPALHAAFTAVPAPPQAMTMLEGADPPFTSRAPAEGRAGQPGALLVRLAWQHDVPDPTVLRRTLIGARGEPPIGEAWAATQNPQGARDEVAKALGIAASRVKVNVTLLGGGFGRKSKPDYVVEAALLSRAVGA